MSEIQNPILSQLEGGQPIGTVYGKGESAYFELVNGVRGPLTVVDAAALTMDALKPYMNQQPDKWGIRLRRAFYATGTAFFIAGCLATGYIADSIRDMNQTRARVEQKMDELEPVLDEAKETWTEMKPILDDSKKTFERLQRSYEENIEPVFEKIAELKACAESPAALLDCIK